MDSSSSSSSPHTVEQIDEVQPSLSEMALFTNTLPSNESISTSRGFTQPQRKKRKDVVESKSSSVERHDKTLVKKSKETINSISPKASAPASNSAHVSSKKVACQQKGEPVAASKKLPEPVFKKFNLVVDMGIKVVQYSHFRYSEPFIRPEGHYLRATESIPEPKTLIEYDLDLEDKAWLEQYHNDTPLEQLPSEIPNAFEFVIDNLEKDGSNCLAKTQTQTTIRPSILMSPVIFAENPIVKIATLLSFVMVVIWRCIRTVTGFRTYLKDSGSVGSVCSHPRTRWSTSTNNWAHLTCALWIPEISFGNTVYMEPIEGINRVPKSRKKLKGYKHEINIEEVQKRFAQKQLEAQKARSYRRDSTDSESDGGISKSARAHNQSFMTTEAVIPPHIFSKVLKSLAKFKIRRPMHFLDEVCKYWSLKKEDRRNAPLIKRLHLEPWTATPSALKSEEEKLAIYGKLKKVRSDLEKVRMLIDLVRKRETCKLNVVRTQLQYWETNFFPQVRYFRVVLERLIRLDTHEYFTQPVTKEQAPDYLEVIDHPMDLGTLFKLVNSHQVVKLIDFKEKLLLVYRNCLFYNSKGTIYYKAAARHQKRALELLEIISQALSGMPSLSLEQLICRFDIVRCFCKSPIVLSRHPMVTPPQKATTSKRTPEKVREASPPLTRSKKRYFDCYDFRTKSHLKLKSHLNTHKRSRQTTLTSPSNRLKLFKKSASVASQCSSKLPDKNCPKKPVQTSMLTYLAKEELKRSPRKSHPPDRFIP
ncbi:hypothetical protein L0F63_001137 [Massospora cicadina]|nr:hypothetical protein L0F63_001137 [Massospora cicadina]